MPSSFVWSLVQKKKEEEALSGPIIDGLLSACLFSGEYTLAIFHRILKGSHIPVGTTSFKEQECSPITHFGYSYRIRVQVSTPLRFCTCTDHSLFRSGNELNFCCSTLSPANPEKTNLEKGLFQGTDEALYRRYKAQT